MHGVLPSQEILALIKKKHISAKDSKTLVQPNSIDLPLGKRCWRLRSIRLPRTTEKVTDIIKEQAIDELDLSKGAILERNAVYIAEIDLELNLPKELRAECDSKSSTGRIDVQTRLLIDNNERYDTIPGGYKGKLYLFISSNSFIIRVKQGLSLNQMRLFTGEPVLSDTEAKMLISSEKLLYVNNKPLGAAEIQTNKGAFLRLDLKSPVAGYRAKFTNAVVDLTRIDNPAEQFWEAIPGGSEAITLEKGQFYILSTLEAIRVPPTHCVWLPPFRPEFGEFRSHYAGFIDSGFGYGKNGEIKGANITLEVRSQDNSLTLLHGTPVAPALFMRNAEQPDILYGVDLKSNYQAQRGPKLAKYFAQKK